MTKTLLHVFPTFAVGGAQVRTIQLVNHFGRDYRHVFVAMDGVTEARNRLSPETDAEMLSVRVTKGDTWANLKTFRGVLASLRPDLLITYNWGSIEWAMANLDHRVRHLHIEDGFGPEEAAGQLRRRVWTRRVVLRRSTVLLPSMTLVGIARDIWRLPRKRVVFVPNGIDCRRFDVPADVGFAAEHGIAGDLPVIGTVAALRAEKNLRRLVDAFALVVARRPARLVIVGDGAERGMLEAHAASLGLEGKVVFTGACYTPERLLPSFDVFALSSDTEQMPISVLEAMAAGRPLAATDVGDVARMVADANVPLVVQKQPDALADAILTLLADPDRTRAIGAANGARAREVYDQALMFAAYRKIFDGAEPRA